jgi:hypothetical protein
MRELRGFLLCFGRKEAHADVMTIGSKLEMIWTERMIN